ncbi:hypothetical protein VTK56DRAFT_3216 [Thermocarpiscus australiensis]
MAEVEEPRFTTLAERIAALNQQKNFQTPPPGAGKPPPPPPPPTRHSTEPTGTVNRTTAHDTSAGKSPTIPPRPARAVTEKAEKTPPPLPRRTADQDNDDQPSGLPASRPLPPPLPSRNSQQPTPPALPSRRPSAQTLTVRRNSNSSDVSQISTVSSLSLNHTRSTGPPETQTPRRLPPPLEQAKLPPLPPTRRELEAKAKEAAEEPAASDAPSLPPRRIADPPRPSLPPRLPSRPANSPAVTIPSQEPSPALPARRLPPPPASFRPKSALDCGFNSGARRPSPPPIPLSSRPTLAEIDAARSRVSPSPRPAPTPATSTPQQTCCLICRDFSGPDTVASLHPTSSLPRHQDPISHLARVLCEPFPSPTDKARAIFTWCHHNIAYDVHGFFNNCVPRGQSPADTIFSGRAVCEGYARVFEAVATRAGLDCVVVTGHGKGYGFKAPTKAAGQQQRVVLPARDPTGHAWNAVRIDGGAWKLVDACWGAGALGGDGQYSRRFAPECFTMSNEDFGTRHFPADARHWYRRDGRALSWEEYILGPLGGDEPAEWLGDATREGLDQFNFAPAQKRIAVYGGQEVVRFQFAKLCEHWVPERHGEGEQMLFALKIGGLDGRKEDLVPLEYDGFWHYLDVKARDLGAPGQTVSLVGFQTVDGQSARGLTKEQWLRKKGRCGYSYAYLVRWELV